MTPSLRNEIIRTSISISIVFGMGFAMVYCVQIVKHVIIPLIEIWKVIFGS